MMSNSTVESATHRLRRIILDDQRDLAPRAMLDCAAHMLLYHDQPHKMQQIALDHLLERFAATRVDLGFSSARSRVHRISAQSLLADCDVPDALPIVWPNQDRFLQAIWRSPKTLLLDVHHAPITEGLRPALDALRIRAKISRRLERAGEGFGIICIDQTEERRLWSEADRAYLDQFVLGFLSPLILESRTFQMPGRPALTAAEYAVIRLAVLGLSYKEIAAKLRKSPRTVDNQLRKIRQKTGARNQMELIRICLQNLL